MLEEVSCFTLLVFMCINCPVAFALETSINPSDMNSETSEQYYEEKLTNFKNYVKGLAEQHPSLQEWCNMLEASPTVLFRLGVKTQFSDVVEACSGDDKQLRDSLANTALLTLSVEHGFDLEQFTPADVNKLSRYISLFASLD